MALIDRISTLTGLSISASTSPSLAEVVQFLKDSQLEVFDRVADLSPEEADLFIQDADLTDGNGTTIVDGRIVYVTRNDGTTDKPCQRIPAALAGLSQDTESLSYRSKYSPVFFIHKEKLFVKPDPTVGEPASVWSFLTDTGIDDGSAGLDNFPLKYERHAVLYSSYLTLLAKVSKKMESYPSTPASSILDVIPSFDVSKPSIPGIPSIVSSASFDTPSFSYNFATLGKIFDGSTKVLTGVAPVMILPVMNVPILETLSDIALPAIPSVPELDTDYSITFSNLTPPTYTKPSPAISAAPNLSTFTISAEVPGPPPVPNFSQADISDTALEFPTPPVFDIPSIPGTGNDLSDINAGAAGGDSGADHRNLSILFDIATDYLITEEDTELQGGVNAQIGTILNAYQQQVAVNLNAYNAQNVKFTQQVQTELNRVQRALTVATTNQQKDLQIQLQQYQQELAAYQGRHTAFTNEVNKEVQEYQIDSQFKLQEWQAKVANEFNLYQNAIQQELNKFNKESSIFQQEVAVEIQNQNWDTQADQTKLAKYGQELGKYQGEVGALVQEFQQNEVQSKFTVWNQEYQNELARYNAMLQGETAKFNESNTLYTAQTQVDMTELANEQAAFMTQMQQQTQLNTANEQQEVQRQIQEYTQKFTKQQAEFTSNLQRYQAEVSTYQAEVTTSLQLHGQELQSYTINLQESASQLQKMTFEAQDQQRIFGNEINKFTNEYNDLNTRMALLKDEYDSAFKVRAEAVQKAAQSAQASAQAQTR
tara:strand:- start:40 stop:2337 length:2298 start_codon:yes stop_codon:yes gene_type:complete